MDFEDAAENPFTAWPTERPTKQYPPRPKAPTLEEMIAKADQFSDKMKRSKADYQKLRKEYEANIVSHNRLAKELDRVKTEKSRLEGTCNHQEEELAHHRNTKNSRSNSRSPQPSNGEKTAQKSMRFSDPPMFTDDKDPEIDNWLVQMHRKMEANVDHMPYRSWLEFFLAWLATQFQEITSFSLYLIGDFDRLMGVMNHSWVNIPIS